MDFALDAFLDAEGGWRAPYTPALKLSPEIAAVHPGDALVIAVVAGLVMLLPVLVVDEVELLVDVLEDVLYRLETLLKLLLRRAPAAPANDANNTNDANDANDANADSETCLSSKNSVSDQCFT